MNLNLTSSSPEATQEIGRKLGLLCHAKDWIGLSGELGAGKTCLVQGIALGLGVDSRIPVTSPTFVIHQTYPGRIPLHHLDFYRLSCVEELMEIGYDELHHSDGAIVVEWFERIPDAASNWDVTVKIGLIDECTRHIEMKGIGFRGKQMLNKLQALLS